MNFRKTGVSGTSGFLQLLIGSGSARWMLVNPVRSGRKQRQQVIRALRFRLARSAFFFLFLLMDVFFFLEGVNAPVDHS